MSCVSEGHSPTPRPKHLRSDGCPWRIHETVNRYMKTLPMDPIKNPAIHVGKYTSQSHGSYGETNLFWVQHKPTRALLSEYPYFGYLKVSDWKNHVSSTASTIPNPAKPLQVSLEKKLTPPFRTRSLPMRLPSNRNPRMLLFVAMFDSLCFIGLDLAFESDAGPVVTLHPWLWCEGLGGAVSKLGLAWLRGDFWLTKI